MGKGLELLASYVSGRKLSMVKVNLLMMALFLCIALKEDTAMAFFNRPVLFSEVTGVVTENGTPLANVEVLRVLTSDDKNYSDKTHTDVKGNFFFKPIYRKRFRLFDLVPHEVVLGQKIIFKHQGKEYKGWFCVKRDYDNNSELEGKPISLICELSNEFLDIDGRFKGICRLR